MSDSVKLPIDGKCGYCGTQIASCAAGEFCPNKDCGYIDGYYRPRVAKPAPERTFTQADLDVAVVLRTNAMLEYLPTLESFAASFGECSPEHRKYASLRHTLITTSGTAALAAHDAELHQSYQSGEAWTRHEAALADKMADKVNQAVLAELRTLHQSDENCTCEHTPCHLALRIEELSGPTSSQAPPAENSGNKFAEWPLPPAWGGEMNAWIDLWKNRPDGCTCPPPWSSRPSECSVHCHCVKNGKRLYDPMIDGRCRRCKNYPLYLERATK